MAQKTGVSTRNLKDFMGFGSYQTIWGWLHKLRTVMVRPNRSLLKGKVEIDETYHILVEKVKKLEGEVPRKRYWSL
jgi:hypothetical protein